MVDRLGAFKSRTNMVMTIANTASIKVVTRSFVIVLTVFLMKINKAVSVILHEELLIHQSAIYTVAHCRVRPGMKAWHRRLRQRYAGAHPNCKVE